MRSILWIVLLSALLSVPSPVGGGSAPDDYAEITQTELVKSHEANTGKRFRVRDVFQFCGSDFCVQFLKTKFDTRQYYCFTLGELCLVRMYLKKDHPDAARLLKLKKGDIVTVYGTFDNMGTNFHFMIVDRLVAEKGE